MGGPSCKHCGSYDIERNDARGETICCNCGAVLEECVMVESIQFSENSSGQISKCGQFFSSSGSGRSGGYAMMYGSRDSREQVLQRGYNNLQRIADNLRLGTQHVEAAQRVYLMAVQRNFTIGRRNLYVASACLYAICRREKTPHMLIDFSDVVQTPVRFLGQVFMKLVRLLHLQVPHIDPSLFMERFASQMNLGEKTLPVASTGVRLIQTMTRDWLSTGRRPTGLCGAALLIAARYHSFRIDAQDISHIVRISGPTVMKRVYEFKHTSTAALTVDEFESMDLCTLPILNGPPCLTRRLRKQLPAIQDKTQLAAIEDQRDLPTSGQARRKTGKQRRGAKRIRTLVGSSLHGNSENEEEREEECDDVVKLRAPLAPSIGIELSGVTQDDICNEEPTSMDIAALANKMLSAIDHRLIGQSGPPAIPIGVPGSAVCKSGSSHSKNSHDRGEATAVTPDGGGTPIDTGSVSADVGGEHIATSYSYEDDTEGTLGCGSIREEVNMLEDLLRSVSKNRRSLELPTVEESLEKSANPDCASGGESGQRLSDMGDDGGGEVSSVADVDSEGNVESRTPAESVILTREQCTAGESPTSCVGAETTASTAVPCTPGSLAEGDDDDILDVLSSRLTNNVSDLNHDGRSHEVEGGSEAGSNIGWDRGNKDWGERDGQDGSEEDERLSDVDDAEINELILNDNDRRYKTLMWDELTKHVMPEVYRRLRQRHRKEKLMDPNALKKKRSATKKDPDPFPEASSAAESVRMALERSGKSIAYRLNDDVLASLFNPTPSSSNMMMDSCMVADLL
eukprot:GHVQ01025362.1.p1 GENE.GHVQ01025362.1~~GHVQ01025362.1.p1  ORF type:complete len:797 (+),score=115.08 GHVQ01025362.1:418-2808(+)